MWIRTNRVQQHGAYVLSIAVLQAWSTELTFGPHTETTATHCLSVQSLLSALVTRASLEENTHTDTHTGWKEMMHQLRKPENTTHSCRLPLALIWGRPDETHILLVPDLVFAAVRYVVQVFFGDLVDRLHAILTPPGRLAPSLFVFLTNMVLVHLPGYIKVKCHKQILFILTH